MKNIERFAVALAVIGVLASIGSLQYLSFDKFIDLRIIKDLSVGVVGATLGAIVSMYLLRYRARTKAPSVFVSYYSANIDAARKIAKELRRVSGRVWIDEYEINVGDNIKDKIKKGLEDSQYVVIILSKQAMESHWVDMELKKAMELGKKILPVKIDDSAVPEAIQNIAYADLSKSFEGGIENLRHIFIKAAHND